MNRGRTPRHRDFAPGTNASDRSAAQPSMRRGPRPRRDRSRRKARRQIRRAPRDIARRHRSIRMEGMRMKVGAQRMNAGAIEVRHRSILGLLDPALTTHEIIDQTRHFAGLVVMQHVSGVFDDHALDVAQRTLANLDLRSAASRSGRRAAARRSARRAPREPGIRRSASTRALRRFDTAWG